MPLEGAISVQEGELYDFVVERSDKKHAAARPGATQAPRKDFQAGAQLKTLPPRISSSSGFLDPEREAQLVHGRSDHAHFVERSTQ
jgi:hypothetical protein